MQLKMYGNNDAWMDSKPAIVGMFMVGTNIGYFMWIVYIENKVNS